MVEIERPKSIFGKVPFSQEQAVLLDVNRDVIKGVAMIKPELAGIPPIFAGLRTKEERFNRMKAFFNRANKYLEEIGV